MLFHTKARVVDAIQFTGVESVAAIQAWMAPQSPLYGPPTGRSNLITLTIRVRDRVQDAQYPSLAPNYTEKVLGVQGWILRDDDGELAVMTDAEFVERFEPMPPVPPIPVDVEAAQDSPAPGDDVDPTTVVDTSHVQERSTGPAMPPSEYTDDPLI